MSSARDVTELLLQWSDGDAEALERLLPLVYEECRRIAARKLTGERREHTLSPTALVHEMYLRLVDQTRASWKSRAQFFGVTAHLMRRILVEHARARRTRKRTAAPTLLALESGCDSANEARVVELLAIDQALSRLATLDPDQERIVELRFFAGLTVEETAHVRARSPRTIKREWQLAKAWLFRELQRQTNERSAAGQGVSRSRANP